MLKKRQTSQKWNFMQAPEEEKKGREKRNSNSGRGKRARKLYYKFRISPHSPLNMILQYMCFLLVISQF